MNLLTTYEIQMLKGVKSGSEWNAACDLIKSSRGGQYPSDWYSVVIVGGIMVETQFNW